MENKNSIKLLEEIKMMACEFVDRTIDLEVLIADLSRTINGDNEIDKKISDMTKASQDARAPFVDIEIYVDYIKQRLSEEQTKRL